MTRRVKAQEVYCVPWSLCTIAPLARTRFSMAMPRALVTREVS
jgi:hypothetical protein